MTENKGGRDAVFVLKHLYVCSQCLPPALSAVLHVTDMASHVCVFLPSHLSSLQTSASHRHTHKLKQLPWQWPSVVIIYSLFTHSC